MTARAGAVVFAVAVALGIGGVGCGSERTVHAQPVDDVDRDRRVLPPKPLSAEARKVLRVRMHDHADNMQSLMWSALLLDYDAVRVLAAKIAKTPRVKRSTPGTLDPLAASLPDAYFPLQDDMYKAVGDLYQAAEARDDAALADSYGRLSAACVSCHAAYMRPEPVPCDRADRDQGHQNRPYH